MQILKVEDLTKLRENIRRITKLRKGGKRAKITVHMGTCGIAAGAGKINSTLLDIVEENKISDIVITSSGCAGLCSREPMVTVEIAGQTPVKYIDLTKKKITEIFDSHVLKGKPVEDYALAAGCERTH